jgi:hypothetical protein
MSTFVHIIEIIVGIPLAIGFLAARNDIREARHARKAAHVAKHGKKYRMRGYGGDPRYTTSLHPRQKAAGKRIVFIPGLGYRHVQVKNRKPGS